MQWQDTGIVLAARRFGESSIKLDVFTREHGLTAGLIKGGASKKRKPQLDIGNLLNVTWRGRLSEQLGQFTIELISQPVHLFFSPIHLAGLNSMCSLIYQCLPAHNIERSLYERCEAQLTSKSPSSLEILSGYVWFEIALLTACGLPLDLSQCAATGRSDQLYYLSPKSGRAVSKEAGAPFHDKLFLLPSFLKTPHAIAENQHEIMQALAITSFFLDHVARDMLHTQLSQTRQRFLSYLTPSDKDR